MGNDQFGIDTLAGMPRSRRLAPFAALLVAAVLPLAACSPAVTAPERPSREDVLAAPDTPPEFVPGGTAEDNFPYFSETLRSFVLSGSPLQGAPVVDALVTAGFEKEHMQVGFDETKTGLVADSLFVSVRIGAECLIGQLITAEESFTAAVQPVVGPEQNICLIGNTRPIDWN